MGSGPRIAVDAMGGDTGPAAMVAGAALAWQRRGDLSFLATALLAPLEMVVLVQQTRVEDVPLERIQHGWDDLVRRVVCAEVNAPPAG